MRLDSSSVTVKLKIPKAVDDFLRRQFTPHELDVMPEYQGAFIRGVEEMLRDDFPKVPLEVWSSLEKASIPISTTAGMLKSLEKEATKQGLSMDELIQQILNEKLVDACPMKEDTPRKHAKGDKDE